MKLVLSLAKIVVYLSCSAGQPHFARTNVWAAKMFIVEVIYFINILANIYLMDVFLGKCYAAIYVNGYLILLLKRWRVPYLWSPSSHNYGARSRRSC